MKNFIVISIVLAMLNSCSQTSKKTELSYNSQEVAYLIGNDTIKGTFLTPKSDFNTVVLIIAGSGPTDRNGNQPMMLNNSLKLLAEGLAENNIASLRYDKRCIGQSKCSLSEEQLIFDNFVDDAAELLKILKEDKRFTKVVVAGHSEGSLIGILASIKNEVDGVISIAGVGKSADLVLLDQLSNIPEKLFIDAKKSIESLKRGITVDNFDPQLSALLRPSVQPYLINWFKYDPAVEISKITSPILIIQGTTDIQVGIEHAQLLHEASVTSKIKIIEGMNHILKNAEADREKNMGTYLNPELPVNSDIISVITEFINNQIIV